MPRCQYIRKNGKRCKLVTKKKRCKRHRAPVYVTPGIVVNRNGKILGVYSGIRPTETISFANDARKFNEAVEYDRKKGARKYWKGMKK